MESKCSEVQINEIHTTSDAPIDHSQILPAVSQSNEQHQQGLGIDQASMTVDNLQGTALPHLPELDEIQGLKEKIRHLQMRTGAASLDSQEAKAQVAPEQYETIQRMKECLRNHSHEWDFRDGLESYSTVDAIENAISHIENRELFRETGSSYIMCGNTSTADHFLSQVYYSDNEEDDDNDEEEERLREKLMVKRREHLKAMALNVETITEGLMKIRLTKKLRKKKKAVELETAAEMKAAEMRAAIVQQQGASNEPSSPPEILQYALAKVNAVDWSSFRTLGYMKESDSCVIDVLIGEPVTEVFTGQSNWTNNWNNPTRTAPQPQKPNPIVVSGPRGQAPLPERIRIHSKPFLKILAQLVDSDGTEIDAQVPSIVFLRPFKVIAHYANRLRDWLKRLEEEINSPPALHGPATEEGAINPTMDASELGSPIAIAMQHLKCILDFIDNHIAAKTAQIHNVDYRKAYFSDLWYLYRPGDEVIGMDGKQAYRVIQVTSTRHRPTARKSPYYNYQFARKKDDESEKSEFTITCVYIDFDGKYIGPVLRTFEIKRFDGERDIASFEVYPLRLHKLNRSHFSEEEWSELRTYPEQDQCRRSLINRGDKFVAVAAVKHMYYSGPTMVVREEVESQVVIDFETAFATEDDLQEHIKRPSLESFIGETFDSKDTEESPDQICACCRFDVVYNDDTFVDKNQRNEYINSLLPKKLTEETPSVALFPRLFSEIQGVSSNQPVFSEDELVIMSYRVFGFVLRSRKWAQLDLTYLTEVRDPGLPIPSEEKNGETIDDMRREKPFERKDTAFGRLVLEREHKNMIISLITQHFRDKQIKGAQTEQVDIIRGKGKGLILLLHGAPGVGKTSTAEGVAEHFRKPLFQITCGDLGVTARDVEKTLETNFNLATKWGCILLLDEADVFLAKRSKEDFVRNGLVAAFLRVLEYYAGILFLTTNRVGDFDEAFTSRIHMSLYYPVLNRDKTLEIFDLNLTLIKDRFKRMGRAIDIEYDGIKRFAKMHFWYYRNSRWNGRQIRNACQTALALAEYQAQGDSKTKEHDPKATITLTVANFETVRNAYLEFTAYLSELYGANTAILAEEDLLRAQGSFDEGREPPLKTDEIYRMFDRQISQGAQRVPRQQRSDTGMNRRENYSETQQNRSGQQPQYSTSKRSQNQADLSSSTKARQSRSLLRPRKSAQPQPPVQQQHLSQLSDMERESVQGFQNTNQRRRDQRDQRQRQQFEDFPDDDDEYSEMQQRELDDVSDDEQEEDNGYDSFGEQSLPAITAGNSRQDARHLDRRRR